MRIALVHSAGTLWLAGNPALVERLHSSAGNLGISGKIAVQSNPYVNGAAQDHTDRGNLATTVSFSTSRLFSTTAAAEIWGALYDSSQPRVGTLVLDTQDGNHQFMAGCVVMPPTRQVIGTSVQLHYQVLGGLLGTVTPASITLDPGGSNNAILFTAVTAGSAGNSLTVQIMVPAAATATTAAAVSGTAIWITPGDSARMILSGSMSPAPPASILPYAGVVGGMAMWSSDGSTLILIGTPARAIIYYNTDRWYAKWGVSGAWTYVAYKVSSATSPAGLTGWTVTTGTTSPTVTAAASDANQATNACFAAAPVLALVTAVNAPGNDGSGVISAVAATHLAGGAGVLP